MLDGTIRSVPRRGRPPKGFAGTKRRVMSAAARRRISAVMKARWAARKRGTTSKKNRKGRGKEDCWSSTDESGRPKEAVSPDARARRHVVTEIQREHTVADELVSRLVESGVKRIYGICKRQLKPCYRRCALQRQAAMDPCPSRGDGRIRCGRRSPAQWKADSLRRKLWPGKLALDQWSV